MIRYNANSPEILGKKQYNVLRGFGWWCLIVGIAGIICASVLVVEINNYNRYWYGSDAPFFRWTHITWFLACAYCSPLFILWGLYAWKGILNISRFGRYGTRGVFSVLACILPVIYFMIFQWRRYYDILPGIYLSALYAFIAYLMWGIVKLFRQSEIVSKCPLTDNPTPAIPTNTSDPFVVKTFELWDPLHFYGAFARYFGFVYEMLILVLAIIDFYDNGFNIKTQGMLFLLFYLSFFFVIGAIGHGLTKQKEWARMLAVLFHAAILLLMLFGIYEFVGIRYMDVINRVAMCSVCFVIAHWCYFVIRTLTSPVVKYVCLRGGHDID